METKVGRERWEDIVVVGGVITAEGGRHGMRDHMEVSAPYYILVSRSSPSSHALGHPIIQYHYADDSPLALWPQTPGQQVLVLDYNPASPSPPTVNSISKHITVTALHTLDAPGAAAAADNDHKNDTMYIIDTTAIDDA